MLHEWDLSPTIVSQQLIQEHSFEADRSPQHVRTLVENLIQELTIGDSCRDGFNIRHDRSLGTFERNLVLASTDSLKDLPKLEGTHEFPFKIPLAAKMPASFAGPNHKHHSYEVQVIISRRFKSDIVVSKPLRIYHPPPFDLESLASYQPTDFEGQSDNEIQFRVSVPNQIIPFGSMLPVECWFAPLSKDWKLHTATIAVAQKHSIQLDATAAESSLLHISKVSSTQTYDIFFEKHQLLADDQREDLFFNGLVRLPTSWDSYSQSITSKIITITHSLVVTAEFQSPDGAKSTKVGEISSVGGSCSANRSLD
ncbi:hypothetical protein N7468_003906 [Penicillium chermesinum]|uniref:Arrestin-like N-terminal domain-containing protein n=1 Tax=Penicillium chermesinum TaxID=63820 RepID=A0A9W9TS91_9EURO|nr:uncharacterized protein N7468_003906 [Penicillium chermesinum]KAJ5239287.1 hypothetical protein N7468_003906 [Penicillium chermesinum]